MSKTSFTISDDRKSLTLERTFQTTQNKLWQAYTSGDILTQWFAPTGWKCTTEKHDFSENGEWIYNVKCVDKEQTEFFGQEMPGKLIYTDINPEDSFGYTDCFIDEDGNVDISMPSSYTLVTFTEQGDATILLKSKTTYESAEALQQVIEMGAQEGLDQAHDKLESLVQN